jgi:hypothetical protein
MAEDNWIRNSLAVTYAEPQGLFVLTTVYRESNPLNAGGQLLHHSLSGDRRTHSILSTGSPLAAMWQSPQHNLWLGGSDGSVWTTAQVTWPPGGPAFDVHASALQWTVTQLPPLSGCGLPPNITAVWCASDSAVFLATASGSVYHWNGHTWQEFDSGTGASLTKLHGLSQDDVYAVGYRGTILHWNGRRWSVLPAPDVANAITIVTGIVALRASGDVFAVTNRGELLRRDGDHFVLVDKAQGARFMGLAPWRSGLAAASADGAWLYDGSLNHVRNTFAATDVRTAGGRLYFIQTEQPQGPGCVEYLPGRVDGEWKRIVF